MEFFSELASNLSAHDMQWILYSGNADTLVAHFGTESERSPFPRGTCNHTKYVRSVVIQNTTFGGIQGFTQKPSTPWYDEEGNFAGKVHQERNLTYAVFVGAGHDVPVQKPIAVSRLFSISCLSTHYSPILRL